MSAVSPSGVPCVCTINILRQPASAAEKHEGRCEQEARGERVLRARRAARAGWVIKNQDFCILVLNI